MAVASLIVKISADINDFSKKLNGLTKDVRKASQQMADVGKDMTLGITVPVGLAAIALGKLGMENEAIANRMKRQFGPAVEQVNANLMELMKVLPLTHSELSVMSMEVNNMMKGMGMAAQQSAQLSTALIQMAGDLAATTGTEIPDAMNALEQALQGRTRGLKQFGVVLQETDIKQEAYRLGILGINRELTPAGTALATYSLLLQRSSQWQGQATERMKDSEYTMALLRRDFIEMAETIGNALVPAFRMIIGIMQAFAKTLASMPPWLIKTIALLLAIAAAVGPLIFIFSKLIGIFFVLKTAIALLMGPAALGGLIALLANPIVLAAVLAITAAIGGAIFLWNKYKKTQNEALKDPPKLPALPSVKDLMKGMGATDQATGDPLAQWRRSIDLQKASLERAVRVGDRWIDSYEGLLGVQAQALEGLMNNIDATDEWGRAYADVYDEVTKIINQLQLMEVLNMKGANVKAGLRRASMVETSDIALQHQAAGNAIQAETQLRLREMTISLANTFDATRVATLELAEAQRQASNDFALEFAKFQQSWANLRGSIEVAGQTFLQSLLAMFGPVGLLLKGFGEVLAGLQPFLDALFVPLAELGRVIGIMLTPILKLLFIPLKFLAIIVAFLGEIIARVSAGISTAVGRLIRSIGKFINAIIPFGNPGNALVRAGEAMIRFGDDQYRAADQLKKTRKEIERLQFGQTQDSLNGLSNAANSATEALLNVPTGFKIALERFRAQQPGERPALPGSAPRDEFEFTLTAKRRRELSQMADEMTDNWYDYSRLYRELVRKEIEKIRAANAARNNPMVVQMVVDGKVLAQALVSNLQQQAQRDFGSTSLWSDVQQVQP